MSVANGFKMTDVGVIPEDWGIEPLGALIGSLDAGVSVRSAADNTASYGHDVMVLKTSCISKGRFKPAEAKPVISADLSRVKTPAKGGSMLISRMNTPDLVGEVGYVAQDWPNLYLPDRLWMACPAAGRKTDMRWLTALLAHGPAGRSLRDAATGTSGSMKNIGKAALRAVLIPSPTPAEQSAIAEALSDMDEAIAAQEAVIAKKRALKTATMQALLSGTRRLPGFSGEWPTTTLRQVSDFITKGATPTTYGFAWQDSGVLFLRSECVSEAGLDLTQSMFISEEAHRVMQRSSVAIGDLLITITGNVGRVVRYTGPEPANLNQHIARIRIVSNEILPDFVFHYLSQPEVRKQYEKITTGQAYPQLSLVQVRDTVIPTPEYAEQEAIASLLTDLEGDAAVAETKLAKLCQLKTGMMQQLLTGKIRLI